jgi:hypothetical protein
MNESMIRNARKPEEDDEAVIEVEALDDDFDEVTEVVLDPEMLAEMEITEEAPDESTIMYELCPMEGISGGIKEEPEDDDRDFLNSFIPHMKRMSFDEKRKFKKNARMVVRNTLSMNFFTME